LASRVECALKVDGVLRDGQLGSGGFQQHDRQAQFLPRRLTLWRRVPSRVTVGGQGGHLFELNLKRDYVVLKVGYLGEEAVAVRPEGRQLDVCGGCSFFCRHGGSGRLNVATPGRD